MKIYLDDDSAGALLVRLLTREGHDTVIPADVGLAGQKDANHFMWAIRNGRTLLTHNHEDFALLHKLVLLVGGHHPGILTVRRDNDPTKDMKPPRIVRALRNLLKAGTAMVDELHVLNHWR